MHQHIYLKNKIFQGVKVNPIFMDMKKLHCESEANKVLLKKSRRGFTMEWRIATTSHCSTDPVALGQDNDNVSVCLCCRHFRLRPLGYKFCRRKDKRIRLKGLRICRLLNVWNRIILHLVYVLLCLDGVMKRFILRKRV